MVLCMMKSFYVLSMKIDSQPALFLHVNGILKGGETHLDTPLCLVPKIYKILITQRILCICHIPFSHHSVWQGLRKPLNKGVYDYNQDT